MKANQLSRLAQQYISLLLKALGLLPDGPYFAAVRRATGL
jgi:hypothetical protein